MEELMVAGRLARDAAVSRAVGEAIGRLRQVDR
jgi:hypothetical protein